MAISLLKCARCDLSIMAQTMGCWILLVLLPLTANAVDSSCFVVTMYGLKEADCDQRRLKTVPDDLDTDIKVLKFTDNELTYLNLDQFKRYRLLQQIYLKRNRIEMIAPDAFRHLHNVQILNLEGNHLTEVPAEAFQYLRSLRILFLKSNQIEYITNDAFQHLPMIEEINLENNWLQRIESQAFNGLSKLDELNLANNDLKTLPSDMGPTLTETLNVLRLHLNPWLCDCRLRWLREWVSNGGKVNWEFNAKNTPQCEGPELINGVSWKQLSPDQFACATHIVANSSTSLQLQVGGNVTIECVVFGDPEPKIMWKKDGHFIRKDNVKQHYVASSTGERQILSALHFDPVTESDAGDYSCVAENSAGRSEVTYKLWVEAELAPATVITVFGLSRAIVIGIGAGAAALVLMAICCAACMYHTFVRKRRTSRTRDYKAKENEENDDDLKEKDSMVVTSPLNAAHTELLITEKEDEETTKENSMIQTIAGVEGEFTMRIFATYDTEDEGEDKREKNSGGDLREATPDLLCDEKHSRPSPKTPTPPPPPAAYFANNLVAAQKRAEENPYVKPNDLKSGGQKAEDTVDYAKTDAKPIRVGTNSHIRETQAKDSPPLSGGDATRSKPHRSSIKNSPSSSTSSFTKEPCSNPVCLKNHTRSKSTQEPCKMSNSQSAGSLSDLDNSTLSDRCKTLPSKSSLAKTSRKLPSTPSQQKPRVQFAVSPVKESPSSSARSTPTSPLAVATLGRGVMNPLHPKGLKVMSPEGPRTLTFPGAIEPLCAGSPAPAPSVVKPSHTYGCSTSVDDLLSPPFGTKEIIKQPGHKDEYGTAV